MPASPAEKRNVVLLAASRGLFQTISVLIMTIGGLAGYMLAADKALATLPISAMSIGTAIATIPASLLMARIGRRGGFILGTIFGAAGGALGVGGLLLGSFWLFCFAHLFMGAYQGWLLLSSGVMAARHMTRAATRAPRRALPRRRALCTNS